MKRFRRYIERLLPAVAVLTLVSCSLDELDEPKKPTNQSGQWGSLVIESLTVNTDNEHLDRGSNSATRTDGENNYQVPNPNGVEENLNNYWIEVFDADGEVVDINGDTQGTGMTYADVTALNTGEGTEVTLINGSKLKLKGIVLPPGEYTVWAYKDATKGAKIPNVLAEDGSPDTNQTTPAYYMGFNTVTVVSAEDLEGNATSTPVEITCKLAQTLVTVEMSADMLEWFDETNSLGVKAKAEDTEEAPGLQTTVTIEPEDPEENETYSYVFPYSSNHGVETTTGTGESVVTTISGGPFVYFKDHAGANDGSGNTMVFKMEGVYLNVSIDNLQAAITDLATNGNSSSYYKNLTYVSMEREIKGVRAAQWRRISIDIDHNTEGDVQFEVTIDSYVFDETIDVDVQTLFFTPSDPNEEYREEEVPDIDPSAPSVQFNIPVDAKAAIIAQDGYDTQMGKWNANLQMTVTPSNNTTIKEVYAVISSDNSKLMKALEDAGYTEGRVTFYSGVSTLADTDAEVSYFVVENPATTAPNIVVKLSDHGMAALQNSYRGTHNIKVWTKDSKDRMKYTDLVIESGKTTGCNIGSATGGGSGSGDVEYNDNPPTIVGPSDDFFDKRHDLTADNKDFFDCAATITSHHKEGFTGFDVIIHMPNFGEGDITSVLGGEYDPVAKTTTFSLTNPDVSKVPALKELTLIPANMDNLTGASQAVFDVSPLMSVLYDATSGECEFTIKVSDKNGDSTETIMFNIVK
ncbi:MAG: DUF4493 domain-containing protein [Alistipes sp.]|nr:DUF4493 domain-containing protein [Alistipes sp.]